MTDLIEHRVLQDMPKPERIIIMLHGIGQHSGYMEEAGRMFSERLPNTLIVMPDAPLKMHYSAEKTARVREKYDPGFDPDKARSWFKTKTSAWPRMMLQLAFNSLPIARTVNALADHYRDKYGLEDKGVAFFGMSQGGAIALYSAISREKPCAGVVSHSGMFFGFARTQSKPDVLMLTGKDDDYLCDNKSFLTSFFIAPENSLRRLRRRGIPVTDFRCPGLGHEMNRESLSCSADFLARAFRQPANANAPAEPKPQKAPQTLSS